MPMDIPTIEITAPEFTGLNLMSYSANSPVSIESGSNLAQVDLPARVAPIYANNSNAIFIGGYNPGSVDYNIVSVVLGATDDLPETPIEVDPKTFIDNYGIIHVGESNLTPWDAVRPVVITFTATYHYVNPSDGTAASIDIGTFKITATRMNVNVIQNENTAIQYQSQPGTNG